MRETGCVRIETEETHKVADAANSYFDILERTDRKDLTAEDLGDPRLFTRNYRIPSYEDWGMRVGVYTSFKEKSFAPILLNADLAAMLYNYFRRQPYYRHHPTLEYVAPVKAITHGDEFHVDRFHQISAMLLTTDQTIKDTHMEYVPESHKRSLLKTGIMLTDTQSAEWAAKAKDRMTHLTGRKGTMFVFDTTGIHARRLIPNTVRKMFHLTWTTGHHLGSYYESRANWPELEGKPHFVRNMFGKMPRA